MDEFEEEEEGIDMIGYKTGNISEDSEEDNDDLDDDPDQIFYSDV